MATRLEPCCEPGPVSFNWKASTHLPPTPLGARLFTVAREFVNTHLFLQARKDLWPFWYAAHFATSRLPPSLISNITQGLFCLLFSPQGKCLGRFGLSPVQGDCGWRLVGREVRWAAEQTPYMAQHRTQLRIVVLCLTGMRLGKSSAAGPEFASPAPS